MSPAVDTVLAMAAIEAMLAELAVVLDASPTLEDAPVIAGGIDGAFGRVGQSSMPLLRTVAAGVFWPAVRRPGD